VSQQVGEEVHGLTAQRGDRGRVGGVERGRMAERALVNALRPLAMDWDPPGVVKEGVGGARRRWKLAKFWTDVVPVSASAASRFCTELGTFVK
jgi:hypothetical protein